MMIPNKTNFKNLQSLQLSKIQYYHVFQRILEMSLLKTAA